jgi:hypothetical protein
MATLQFICANWTPGSTDCKKVGRYSCKNCYLVVVGICMRNPFSLTQHGPFLNESPSSTAARTAKVLLGYSQNRLQVASGQGNMESRLGSGEPKTGLCQRGIWGCNLEGRNTSGATFRPLMFFNLDQAKVMIMEGSCASCLPVRAV